MYITRDDVKWANNKTITDVIFPLYNILNIYNDWFKKYHRKKRNVRFAAPGEAHF